MAEEIASWWHEERPSVLLGKLTGSRSLCCQTVWSDDGAYLSLAVDGAKPCSSCDNASNVSYERLLSWRQIRLITCGLCRQAWYGLKSATAKSAITMAEEYADEPVSSQEVQDVRAALRTLTSQDGLQALLVCAISMCLEPGSSLDTRQVELAHGCLRILHGQLSHLAPQMLGVMKDVGGCLDEDFRLPTPLRCPACRGTGGKYSRVAETETLYQWHECPDCQGHGATENWRFFTQNAYQEMQSIARSAYHERQANGLLDNGLLSILADHLEDAGCQHVAMISHLREKTNHYRGCWVVDFLLGKFCRNPVPA